MRCMFEEDDSHWAECDWGWAMNGACLPIIRNYWTGLSIRFIMGTTSGIVNLWNKYHRRYGRVLWRPFRHQFIDADTCSFWMHSPRPIYRTVYFYLHPFESSGELKSQYVSLVHRLPGRVWVVCVCVCVWQNAIHLNGNSSRSNFCFPFIYSRRQWEAYAAYRQYTRIHEYPRWDEQFDLRVQSKERRFFLYYQWVVFDSNIFLARTTNDFSCCSNV